MTSTALRAGGARGTDWITAGSVGELAVIASLPLPPVPAQWLRQRWRRDDRWVTHTRRILSDPTYLALHRWTTLAFPAHPGQWNTLAAALITYAPRVSSGELSPQQLRSRVERTLHWLLREDRSWGGAGRRQQNRYRVTDRLVPGDRFADMAEQSTPRPAATVESSVIGWLIDVVGEGWLTAAARQVLAAGMDLAAEFVASSGERAGLDVLTAATPSNTTCPTHRLTHVLGHLPRPARDALRCFVLGPTERTGVGGPANSLIVWVASDRHPSTVPPRLVSVWRYHAAMLDPDIAEIAATEREPRDRLRRYAARPDLASPVALGQLLPDLGPAHPAASHNLPLVARRHHHPKVTTRPPSR